jgi:hypothetical protein
MSVRCRLLSGLLLALAVLAAAPARATLAVPLPPEDLAADADAIVLGRVARIRSFWRNDEIVTRIAIAVDEVLKGQVGAPRIRITQVGGRVAGVESWIHGSPEFDRGERVLVFLTEQSDGSLRVSHLFLGKYSVVIDPASGDEIAVRDPNPAGVHLLQRPGPGGPSPDADALALADLRARIARHAAGGRPGRRLGATAGAPAEPLAAEESDAFAFFPTPSRWFEPDSGDAIEVRVNAAGEPRAPSRGLDQARDALAAWSTVPGAALRLHDGGSTTAGGLVSDGVTSISFRDPRNQIGTPPAGCAGILAIGGHFTTGTSRTVNGLVFRRIVEGDLTTNKGWEGCGVWEDYDRLAEVLVHELGHVLGFAHSTDPGATMAPRAHFDGRGASLADSDREGVVFAYPGPGLADLVVTSLGSPPAAAAPGAEFAVRTTVKNRGTGDAGSSRLRFFLSAAPPHGDGDVRAGRARLVPALAPGALSRGRTRVRILPGTPPGTYRLVACADADAAVAEASEANNCRASAGAVVVSPPAD